MTTLPLLLHVGFHKTATSWMQQLFFHPEHGYHQIADHADVFEKIVKPHGLDFDFAPIRDLIANRRSQVEEGLVPVISSEILSGNLFFGGRESDSYANQLKSIAPDARILISIRAQLRILPSVYMQYLRRGGTMPWDQFFKGTNELGYFAFAPEHFEYDRLVAKYQSLFGPENVYVLTQESLKSDMELAARRLSEFARAERFAGLSEAARRIYSPSYPEYVAPVLRRINHIQSSTLNPWPVIRLGQSPKGIHRAAGFLLRKPPFSVVLSNRRPISDHVERVFAHRYDASNARLSQLVAHPIDLSNY